MWKIDISGLQIRLYNDRFEWVCYADNQEMLEVLKEQAEVLRACLKNHDLHLENIAKQRTRNGGPTDKEIIEDIF